MVQNEVDVSNFDVFKDFIENKDNGTTHCYLAFIIVNVSHFVSELNHKIKFQRLGHFEQCFDTFGEENDTRWAYIAISTFPFPSSQSHLELLADA